MAKKKHGGGGGGHGGGWVITFADLMALLMALFVMIVSFSNQDEQKLHDAAGSMREAFGVQPLYRPAGMIESNGNPLRPFARDNGPPVSEGAEFADLFDDSGTRQGPETQTNDFAKQATHDPHGYLSAAATIRQSLQDLPDFAELSKQVIFRSDVDGLHISIVDHDGRPMFDTASRQPLPRMQVVLGRIAPAIDLFPGRLKVIGHVSATTAGAVDSDAQWDLSAGRAVAALGVLTAYGLKPDKTIEVTGRAALDPLFEGDPFLAANRRVELLLVPEASPVPDAFHF